MKYLPRFAAALVLGALGGCVHQAPDVIRYAPVEPVTADDVRAAPERFRDVWVRWGGSIVKVENRPRETQLEILARPLGSGGYPDPDAVAGGRFVARVSGFLDPAEYAPERLVTVVGRVAGSLQRTVGEYPYRYPVVAVRASHLWPVPEPVPCCPRHPWYDPWYDPWYPWWRYPYRW